MKKSIFCILLTLIGVLVLLPLGLYLTFRIADRTNGSLISSGQERRYLRTSRRRLTSPNPSL